MPKRASTVLGPRRRVADWPGWNWPPSLAHDLKVFYRRSRFRQQRHGFGLGIERIEASCLARCPAARRTVSDKDHSKAQLLVACTALTAQVAAADLEQAAPQAAPRCDCAARRTAAREAAKGA